MLNQKGFSPIILVVLALLVIGGVGLYQKQTSLASLQPTSKPTESATPTSQPTASPTTSPKPKITAKPTSSPTKTTLPTSASTPTPTSQNNTNSTNAPVVNSMSASNSNFGQYVNYTIAGNNFGSSQGTATVFDNNNNTVNNSSITGWQNTSIQANIVGSAGTSYSLEVTTSDGKKSNRYSFTQPLGQPYLTPDNISPKGAKPGETVTISGDRFDSGNGRVTFNDSDGTIVSWNNTEIKVTIPTSLSPTVLDSLLHAWKLIFLP
jgi:hypothetical protein